MKIPDDKIRCDIWTNSIRMPKWRYFSWFIFKSVLKMERKLLDHLKDAFRGYPFMAVRVIPQDRLLRRKYRKVKFQVKGTRKGLSSRPGNLTLNILGRKKTKLYRKRHFALR